MMRFRIGVLVALVALLATEPIYHNHPLIPDGNTTVQNLCAVCASGAAQVTLSAPAVFAPDVVAYALEVPAVALHALPLALSLSSRAPPAV